MTLIHIAFVVLAGFLGCHQPTTRNVVLTGYWPPTSQMLVEFSTDRRINPEGWKGHNWRGLGYDVYSFFPKVDYQDSRKAFERIVGEYNPLIIVCYGATEHGDWEIEQNAIMRAQWQDDLAPPLQPDMEELSRAYPPNTILHSTLPADGIERAVNSARIGIMATINRQGDAGDFLCNYLACLAIAYQETHADPSLPNHCAAAGFIHVGSHLSIEQTRRAQLVTLETILR